MAVSAHDATLHADAVHHLQGLNSPQPASNTAIHGVSKNIKEALARAVTLRIHRRFARRRERRSSMGFGLSVAKPRYAATRRPTPRRGVSMPGR